MPTLDSVDLSRVAGEGRGASGTVYHVKVSGGSDSNDGLSWGTAFATLGHAVVVATTSGDLILMGLGTHVVSGSTLTLSVGVSMKGFDRESTIIASTLGTGVAFTPGNYSTIEGVTLDATSASHVFGWGGTTTINNAVLRNCRLLSTNTGDLINVTSSVAGALTVENVIGRCIAGGNGIFSTSAAHEYRLTDSYFLLFGSAAVAGINLSGAANARGYRIEVSLPDAIAGEAIKVANTSQVELFDSQLYAVAHPIDIVDATAAVRMVGGQFDRSLVTGHPEKLIDTGTGATTWKLGFTGSGPYLVNSTNVGVGGFAVTVNVKDSGSSANITGAAVRVAGAQSAGPATTDSSGNVTLNLSAGSVSLLVTATGYQNSPIISETIDGSGHWLNGTATRSLTLTSVNITTPASPDQTTGYGTTRDGQGNAIGGQTVTFRMVTPPTGVDEWQRNSFTAISDSSGLLQVALLKGATYQAQYSSRAWSNSFVAGSGSTYAIPMLLGDYSPDGVSIF